jgi:hypothetical protein
MVRYLKLPVPKVAFMNSSNPFVFLQVSLRPLKINPNTKKVKPTKQPVNQLTPHHQYLKVKPECCYDFLEGLREIEDMKQLSVVLVENYWGK